MVRWKAYEALLLLLPGGSEVTGRKVALSGSCGETAVMEQVGRGTYSKRMAGRKLVQTGTGGTNTANEKLLYYGNGLRRRRATEGRHSGQAKAAEEAELRTTPERPSGPGSGSASYETGTQRSCSQRLRAGGGILIIYAQTSSMSSIKYNASGEEAAQGGAGSDGVPGVNAQRTHLHTEAATAPAAAAAGVGGDADTADTAAAAAQEALYFFPLQ